MSKVQSLATVLEVGTPPRGVDRSVTRLPARSSAPGPSPAGDGYPLGAANPGLTVCRRLLWSMDSELEFETWPGRGTRFHFAPDLPPRWGSARGSVIADPECGGE